MKRLTEHEPPAAPSERTLHSIRAVMARACDLIWQAGPDGSITSVTPCRPAAPSGEGDLDQSEVQRVEQDWRRCVRCAERLNTAFHVRRAGSGPRSFLLQAVPVLDRRDEVLFWSGSAVEVDRFSDPASLFISEATDVLSSSLNRPTIVNRLVEASIDHFCDLCAVHIFDDEGVMHCEAIADRRAQPRADSDGLLEALDDAVRTRQPVLLLSAALRDQIDVRTHQFLRRVGARSMIVVPLVVGTSCIGTLSFLESERSTSFAARDVDVAVVAGRQLAMALENIKTFEREQRITERFRFMARVTERLFTTLERERMLTHVLESLCESFADYGLALALDHDRLTVLAPCATNARLREAAEREIVASLNARRPILAGAVSTVGHGTRLRAGPLYQSAQPRSWMMVPLFAGASVRGALICCANSRVYDSGDLELFEEIGRRVSLALEHAESFARERRLVQTLQQATLPSRLARVPRASVSAIYRPAAEEVQVGGDWYDAFDLDDHRVLLTVGDVTGHGLEASIVMGKLRHAINVVAMYERDPVRILDAAERVLLRRYPGSVATAFTAILDARNATITYANAGHPYPILRRRDGSLVELEADGLPIGLRSAGSRVKPVVERLDDAALIAFYTDGLIETTRDMLAGERQLHEALSTDAIFYAQSPAEFVEQYCAGGKSRDDVAVLLLNFIDSRRWTFDSLDSRAARAARRDFLACLSKLAAPDSDLKTAELIFGELAANVAQHGGGKIDTALAWPNGRAVLHVIVRGEGYAATQGVRLIQRLGAQIDVEPLPGYGTHVRADLPIRSRNPAPSQ